MPKAKKVVEAFPLVTMEDIAWKISYEGIGYSIQHYFSPKNIAEVDEVLAKKWKKAQKLLNEIEAYVNDKVPPETFAE